MSAYETIVIRGLLFTVLIGMLMACGGGSGGSASTSEPVIARGVITNLGSIWVNGVEYETPNGGSYSNDDQISTIASYEVGQVVSLRGRRSDNGVSGTADEVEYEAEIEGLADSATTINGVTILIDDNTNLTLAPTIINGALDVTQRYEVSGFWVGDLIIQATFIKHDDDSGAGGDGIDEVKGLVTAVDLLSIPPTLTVHGVTYDYSGVPIVAVDDFVEIHFQGTIASEVHHEDDFFDNLGEGQEVEIEGVIDLDTTGCPPDAHFKINSTCINWDMVPAEWMDGLNDFNDLVTGSRAEAEGHTNTDGLLIAEKIKGRGNRVRINATASNVVDGGSGSGTLDVFGGVTQPIQVTALDGLTEIDINGSTLFSSIGPTAGLEIRGIRTGATSVLALRIKDDSVGPTDHELRAEVDLDGAEGSDISTNNITVMGISSLVDANTKLKDEGIIIQPGDGSTTLDQIDSNLDLIDDDNDPTNGARHIVQVLIDTTNGDGSSGNPYTTEQVEIEREDD
jgi:hypothetical protein